MNLNSQNNNKIILSIEKSLAEKENSIIYAMENNKKILLNSRMKTGKTYLTANIIARYFNNKDIKILFVSPVNLLIEQHIERYGDFWSAQNSKYKSNINDMAVITTPDSLPKEIEKCEECNKKFVLVVDEAHEVESSQGFRKAFKNIQVAETNNLCVSTLYLTATPQNILNSISNTFNRIIEIHQDKDTIFKNGNVFELRPVKMNILNIVQTLINLSKEYDQVFYKVDNHKKQEEIDQHLKLQGVENHIYLSSKNKEENPIFEYIKNDKVINHNYKIIGFTSLINSGIEIKTKGKICVVNFTNSTFNFINEIQMIGRFREGVNRYILTIPINEEEEKNKPVNEIKEPYIKPYKEIYEELKADEEFFKNSFNRIYKNEMYSINEIKEILKSHLSIELDELTRDFNINYTILAMESYKRYVKQFLKYPSLLLNEFKNCGTLEFDKYILNDNSVELTKITNKTIETNKIIKDNEKKEKAEFKQELLKLYDYMKKLDSEILLQVLNFNPLGLNTAEKEIYNLWYELTEIDESIEKTLKEIRKCDIDLLTAFKILSNDNSSQVKRIKKGFKGITFNKMYFDDKEEIKKYSKRSKEHLRHFKTMEYIQGHFKNSCRITDVHYDNLIKIYNNIKIPLYTKNELYVIDKNKKRQLNTKLKNDVINYLDTMCIITEEIKGNAKTFKFSSLRKNLNDLIC